jgi:hypothetical protein
MMPTAVSPTITCQATKMNQLKARLATLWNVSRGTTQ